MTDFPIDGSPPTGTPLRIVGNGQVWIWYSVRDPTQDQRREAGDVVLFDRFVLLGEDILMRILDPEGRVGYLPVGEHEICLDGETRTSVRWCHLFEVLG